MSKLGDKAMGILTAVGLTLPIAIAVRWGALRLVPLLVPKGRLKTVGASWLGGLVGNYVAQALAAGPTVAGVSLWGAVVGSFLVLLALGLHPFLRILVGRT